MCESSAVGPHKLIGWNQLEMISYINSDTDGYLIKWPVLTTKHQPVRCEPGAPLLLGADAAGNSFQEGVPVAHGLVAELGKPGLQSPVGSLCQSISLRMVGRRDAPSDPIVLTEIVNDLWETKK